MSLKVGDRVTTDTDLTDYKVPRGTVGTVIDISRNGLMPIHVEFGTLPRRTERIWFFDHELTPADGQPIPDEGMTSVQLADYVEGFIRACRGRIIGVGNEQYASADGQAFEKMTPRELIRMAREEAQDGAVYMGMLDILLARLETKMTEGIDVPSAL